MIVYKYENGTEQTSTYEDITIIENGKMAWNRSALRRYAEPVRPVEIVCTCREDGHVIQMHFVEKPAGSRRYYLATNPNLDHHPKCLKHRVDDVKTATPNPTKRAIQMRESDGKTVLNVHINLFSGGVQESEDVSESLDHDLSMSPNAKYVKSEESTIKRRTRRRAQVRFGGLIREWYLMGRDFACNDKQHRQISQSDVLHGMWRVMLAHQIEVTDTGESLKKSAYVPHKSIKSHTEGEQKIIIGLVDSMDIPEAGEKIIHIRGISDTWSTVVPIVLGHRVHALTQRHLIAVRAIRRDHTWRLTHLPFAVILANPAAMWVESNVEAEAYALIVKTPFTVDKPLHVMKELGGLRPDFILHGLNRPVMVEIYGRTGDPNYDEHKEFKQDLYTTLQHEGLIYYLEWDLSESHGRSSFVHRLAELSELI